MANFDVAANVLDLLDTILVDGWADTARDLRNQLTAPALGSGTLGVLLNALRIAAQLPGGDAVAPLLAELERAVTAGDTVQFAGRPLAAAPPADQPYVAPDPDPDPQASAFDAVMAALSSSGGNFGALTPQDVGYHFDYGKDPDRASANLLRTRGIEPSSGNPMATFMQGLLPGLLRGEDLYNVFTGANAGRVDDPNTTENEAALAGNEALAANLGGGMGLFGRGATGRFNPQQGREFLSGLNTQMNNVNSGSTAASPFGTLNQQLAADRFAGNPGDVWQTIMDVLGPGMSPMLRSRGNTNATFQRLFEQFQNQGTGAGSFLNWITPMTQR